MVLLHRILACLHLNVCYDSGPNLYSLHSRESTSSKSIYDEFFCFFSCVVVTKICPLRSSCLLTVLSDEDLVRTRGFRAINEALSDLVIYQGPGTIFLLRLSASSSRHPLLRGNWRPWKRRCHNQLGFIPRSCFLFFEFVVAEFSA